ncbi:MAG: metallophosphoesterase, partial [Phascolarctobacterium sp.]|nr:metallophosphoesterase [Phascolarctobacterium sp.]
MLRLMKNLFMAVLMVFVSTVCALPALAADKDIVILYTNDIHCGIEDNEGFARLSQYKKDLLAQTPYVALVDAGDAIQGAPIGKLSNGEAIVNIMNTVGYDFAIPGNHEFDYGMKRFLELNDLLACGYYSCNFVDAYGENILPAYKIMTFGDTKIAF